MITVQVLIEKSILEVWDKFTTPENVINWNFASDDWHCPKAENDVTIGGKFVYTMAAKDDSASFDFNGIYSEIELHKKIAYSIEGGRKVIVTFEENENNTLVIENFEPEDINSIELQQQGWQSILDNFKKYTEQ
jgi:uncharacterized protein YndB with AHSA1/START domain